MDDGRRTTDDIENSLPRNTLNTLMTLIAPRGARAPLGRTLLFLSRPPLEM